jgi:flagellar basal body-associated protein FliL
MSDEADKAAAPAPKKSKTGLIIGIVIALVTLVGGSVAGAVLGPKLLGGEDHAAAAADEDDEEEESAPAAHESSGHDAKPKKKGKGKEEKIVSVDINPIVVDLRDADGRLRHLKVGLAAELGETANVEEFKLMSPRGREATLSYLRSLTFEDVSDPARYTSIKDEISKRMIEAIGPEKVHRILLVDFVLQ